MFKILLPVDFSDSTATASQYALALAAVVPDSQILLLHCSQDYLAEADMTITPIDELTASEIVAERVLHRNEEEAQNQLEELYLEMQNQSSKYTHQVRIERAFMHGLPEDKIPEQIQRYKANLLVMGTKGEAGLMRSFFGTVATEVARNVAIPVLTVPENYTSTQLHKVLFATDFDSEDVRSLATLQQFLYPFGASIVVAHISDKGDRQEDNQKLETLKQNLEQNSNSGNISYTLLTGDNVAEALQEFVQQQNIDMIAVTARKHEGLNALLRTNTVKNLILHAPVPLLVFHSPDVS